MILVLKIRQSLADEISTLKLLVEGFCQSKINTSDSDKQMTLNYPWRHNRLARQRHSRFSTIFQRNSYRTA